MHSIVGCAKQAFHCYLPKPDTTRRVPAIVLASAIHGVDEDLRAIADEFASLGYIAAAPDLFWRTIPGPLPHGDDRCRQRSEPRRKKLRSGEPDLVSVLVALRNEPTFNGRAVLMGFCYGGPYAILGPSRLSYDAGVACHGSRMMSVIHDLRALHRPAEVLRGDQDRMAPQRVLRAYGSVQDQKPQGAHARSPRGAARIHDAYRPRVRSGSV